MSREDWNAAMSSEVFREYLKGELFRGASPEPDEQPSVSNEQALISFSEAEENIKNDPRAKVIFKALQEKLANDPDYYDKTDPKVAETILMFDLDGEKEDK
jgi:hypothetical protein